MAFREQRASLEELFNNSNEEGKSAVLAQYTQLHYDMLNVYYGAYNEEGIQDIDSAIWILSTAKYLPNFQVQRASLYASLGKWGEAFHVLSDIPVNFSLSDLEIRDIEELITLYKIQQFLVDNQYDWSLVSSIDKDAISDIAQNGEGMTRFAARYFLSAYAGIQFDPEIVELDEEDNSAQNKMAPANAPGTIQNTNAAEQKVLIYPNPTADGVVKISGVESGSQYRVTDLSGRMLSSGVIDGTVGTINLARFASGSYFLQIVDAAGKASTFKVARQ